LVAIAELGAPPFGGLLFAKAGRERLLAAGMVVLAVDFVMRLLLVEKKVASAYIASEERISKDSREETDGPEGERAYDSEPTEDEALLPQKKADTTRSNKPIRILPILYCLATKRLLLVALGLGLVQALIIGTYDATLAIEAATQFGFSSMETGFLFLAIGLPSLLFAPLGGWAVDKYGTRVVATTGFGLYAPFLALLRLSSQGLPDRNQNIALFSLILAMNGGCLSVVGTAGIVEANNVIDTFVRADPSFFGANGAYGQLFGLTTFAFNAGLTLGPLCSGPLRESFGYGNMYAMVELIAATAAILSFAYLGERDEV
jgi:Major Facilitator Superfamily